MHGATLKAQLSSTPAAMYLQAQRNYHLPLPFPHQVSLSTAPRSAIRSCFQEPHRHWLAAQMHQDLVTLFYPPYHSEKTAVRPSALVTAAPYMPAVFLPGS